MGWEREQESVTREAFVPLESVIGVEARLDGWWRFFPRLVVMSDRVSAFDAVPHAEGGEITLRSARRDRERARRVATEVELRRAELELRRVEGFAEEAYRALERGEDPDVSRS